MHINLEEAVFKVKSTGEGLTAHRKQETFKSSGKRQHWERVLYVENVQTQKMFKLNF